MRVLVTGSRDWRDSRILRSVLGAAAHFEKGPGVTLVSGACPTGADRMAEELAEECGWTIERHPADWDRHGKQAGFLRNQEMVDLGADRCVAFILDDSRGATHTRAAAKKAGIKTITVRDWTVVDGPEAVGS